MTDELTALIENLRARAASREMSDFYYGRKRPDYGRETEIEWVAAAAIERAEAENATLRARVARLEEAVRTAETHIVGMYRGIIPAANYDDEVTFAGHVSGNRSADKDECVKMLRAAIKEAQP